jgi:8-oxo-dGTP pyrophosphatase MutT (NUDIX family)
VPVEVSTIVAAVVRRGSKLLLVEAQGPGDQAPIWMLPGGRVEEGEEPIVALRREVTEETGLAVHGRPELAFEVEVELDTDLHAGTYRAMTFTCRATGVVEPNDPDGLVQRAAWVDAADALRSLADVQWYECEPLRRYLAGEAPDAARYRYRVSGRQGAMVRHALEVVALDGRADPRG